MHTPYSVVLTGGVHNTRVTQSADDATLSDLYHQCSKPQELDVQADTYYSASKRERSDIKKGLRYFVGAVINGKRHDNNVQHRTMLTLDIEQDNASGAQPPTPQEVAKRITALGGSGWVYTSLSHTPDRPRYRVVLPLGRHIPRADNAVDVLQASTLSAARKLRIEEWCMPESWVLSQPMYLPAKLKDGPFYQKLVKGKLWAPVQPKPKERKANAPADIPDERPDPVLQALKTAGLYIKAGATPGWHYFTCPFQDQHGQENDTQTMYMEAHFNGFPHPSVRCMDTAPDQDGQPHLTYATLVRWLKDNTHLTPEQQADAGVLDDYDAFDKKADLGRMLDTPPTPREWAIEKLAPVGKVTVIAGPGGVSKSMLMLNMLVYAAMGLKWAMFDPVLELRSLFVSYEDDAAEMHKRVHTLTESLRETDNGVFDVLHDVEGSIRKNLRIFAADDEASLWLLLTKPERFSPAQRTERVEWLVGYIKSRHIKLLALDPAVYTHQLEENDIADMATYMQTLTYIAKQASCAVVVLHHMNKAGGWAQLDDLSQGSLRGASSFADNARSVLAIVSMPIKDAGTYGLPPTPETSSRFLAVKHVKHNYSAPLPLQVFERKEGLLAYRAEVVRLDDAQILEAGDTRKVAMEHARFQAAAPKVLKFLVEDCDNNPATQTQISTALLLKSNRTKALLQWCADNQLVDAEHADGPGRANWYTATAEGKAFLKRESL